MISQERIDQYIKDGHLEVKIIADSISEAGKRITTFQLKYPRWIHAELLTHRVFSRNASSSRAIPVAKMIEQVRTNPAMPIHWGKNQSGMQAKEELTGDELTHAKQLWIAAAESAADRADKMSFWGAHKQIVNRILEPFQHIHVVLTATEFDNFFELRIHEDAQPEIYALALTMKHAMDRNKPRLLLVGMWHLPYITDKEKIEFDYAVLCKISAARCCRVSYLKHDGTNPSIEDDLALFERLVGSAPLHASPLEHQATISEGGMNYDNNRSNLGYPWIQYRKIYEDSL